MALATNSPYLRKKKKNLDQIDLLGEEAKNELPEFNDGGKTKSSNDSDNWLYEAYETVKSTLNPENYGVTRYDDKASNFDEAFAKARRQGYNEFIWDNKRYTTKSDANTRQQLDMYGNTNMITNRPKSSYNIINKAGKYENYSPGEVSPDVVQGIDSKGIPNPVRMNRIKELQHKADDPSVQRKNYYFKQFREFMHPDRENLPATYFTNENTIAITRDFEYLTELAHPYRYSTKHSKQGQAPPEDQLKAYDKPQHEEYRTHSITEPLLREYVRGGLDKQDVVDIQQRMSQFYDDTSTIRKMGEIERKRTLEKWKNIDPEKSSFSESEIEEKIKKTKQQPADNFAGDYLNDKLQKMIRNRQKERKANISKALINKKIENIDIEPWKIQRFLDEMDYDVGHSKTEDGRYDNILGPKTKNTIQKYRKDGQHSFFKKYNKPSKKYGGIIDNELDLIAEEVKNEIV